MVTVTRYIDCRQTNIPLLSGIPACPFWQQWCSHWKGCSEVAVGKQGKRLLRTDWILFLWHAMRRLRETYNQLPGGKSFREVGDLWQSKYVPVTPTKWAWADTTFTRNSTASFNILSLVHVKATHYCLSHTPEWPYRLNMTNFSSPPLGF
jgi:hypothetical protein